ncbi:glycosyltransferase family 4 protein [Erythrobacter sp.]|uniref:glycosyltransferase family 4 protein n=1 Tax=Erythrobacter sp. TaxID=1042 RepID=UPI001425E035|nr:glycosyltransferase family 4 protein [Erythrobacter sp.]QIQ87541.1 MAG: glycosyltransferase family 4 protein [Erythrobacter sp.]
MTAASKAVNPEANQIRSKVVIVGEYVRAEENSTGYFWEGAISHLRSNGVNVEVVSYTRPMSARVRANAFLRLATKTVVALGLTLGILKASRRGDVVFSGTNPEILLPILALVCRLRGMRLCVLVHDVFPENLVAAGLLRRGSPAMRVLGAIYRRVYASFDKAIVIGRDMRELVDQKAGRQIAYPVHNWVDSDDVKAADRLSSGILEKLGWEDRVVFQFFGNMGRLQDIDTLLRAMDLVTTDKAAFLFAGSGVMRSAAEQACEGRDNRHVMEIDHGYSRSAMLSSCDVALVCLDQRMLGLGVPSKAYFSLAADRPILAIMDENAEVARLVTEERIGWHVRAGDPIALAAAIDRICTEEPSIGSGRCRALSKSRLSADLALEQVRRQLERLME